MRHAATKKNIIQNYKTTRWRIVTIPIPMTWQTRWLRTWPEIQCSCSKVINNTLSHHQKRDSTQKIGFSMATVRCFNGITTCKKNFIRLLIGRSGWSPWSMDTARKSTLRLRGLDSTLSSFREEVVIMLEPDISKEAWINMDLLLISSKPNK